MDDRKIIDLLFSRSEQAISEIRIKYNSLCMKIAGSILLNAEDAEECVSTSYLKIWNAIPPKNPESLCGYLCKIVRNTAISAFGKISRRSYEEQYDELTEIIPTGKSLEEEYDSRNISEQLNKFLAGRKQRSRQIFVARYYFNMSVKEIANGFDMSETAVRSRLLRTRNELKEYLTERGVNL